MTSFFLYKKVGNCVMVNILEGHVYPTVHDSIVK